MMHSEKPNMSEPKGTSDESIGRPSEWGEGRYQQRGKRVTHSVVEPSQKNQPPPDTVSTPVTREDYENLEPPPAASKER